MTLYDAKINPNLKPKAAVTHPQHAQTAYTLKPELTKTNGQGTQIGLRAAPQVCAEQQQQFLLFMALLGHVGAEGLSKEDRLAVLGAAQQAGRSLPPGVAASALIYALRVRCHSHLVTKKYT